jgi:hypothetical protein
MDPMIPNDPYPDIDKWLDRLQETCERLAAAQSEVIRQRAHIEALEDENHRLTEHLAHVNREPSPAPPPADPLPGPPEEKPTWWQRMTGG